MDIQGKIIRLLEEQKGEGRNGAWRKQEYILETEEKFPKKICFNLWGDKIDQFDIKEGSRIRVYFDLESREFNGRWYTDVKAWKIENADQGNVEGAAPDYEPHSQIGTDTPPPPSEDDLPF